MSEYGCGCGCGCIFFFFGRSGEKDDGKKRKKSRKIYNNVKIQAGVYVYYLEPAVDFELFQVAWMRFLKLAKPSMICIVQQKMNEKRRRVENKTSRCRREREMKYCSRTRGAQCDEDTHREVFVRLCMRRWTFT